MKNKRIILCAILLIVFPFLATYLTTNFNVDVLHASEKGIKEIDITSIKETNQDIIHVIKLNKKFINKLQLTIKTKNDFNGLINFSVKTIGENQFGYPETNSSDISIHKKIGNTTLSINKVVDRIEIKSAIDSAVDFSNMKIVNQSSFNWYYFLFYSSITSSIGLIFLLYQKKLFHLEYIFLILVIAIGMNMIIFIPKVAHWSPDSEIHYGLAYNTSHFKSIGYSNSYRLSSEVPFISKPQTVEAQNSLNTYLNDDVNNETYGMISKSMIVKYNQWAYLPAAVGLRIGRLLHLPFTWTFSLGKLMNLLYYATLCFFAIKISKKGRRLVFSLSLIPTMMFLTTQYSVDGIIYSSLLLGCSLFISQYLDKDKKVSFGWTFAFLASISFGVFAKAIYAPLVLLALLLNKEKFENDKQRKLFKVGIVIVFLLLMFVMVLPMLSPSTPGDFRGGYTSATGQLYSLLTHPLSFIKMYLKILINSFGDMIFHTETFIGSYYLPKVALSYGMLGMLVSVVLSIIDWQLDDQLKISHKMILSTGICCLILMIFGALYLSFTPVGLSNVNGVQVRYFTPLLLIMLFIPATNKISLKFNEGKFSMSVIAVQMFINFGFIYYAILTTFCQ